MARHTETFPNLKRKRSCLDNDDDEKVLNYSRNRFNCSKYLSPQDASSVTKFLSSHPNVAFNVSSDAVAAAVYGSLAELLQVVKRYTVLEIIDLRHSETLNLLCTLGDYSCNSSWLDSLHQTLSANSNNNSSALQNLLTREQFFMARARHLYEWFENTPGVNAQWFFNNILHGVLDQLEDVRVDKNRVLEARAALQYTHTF